MPCRHIATSGAVIVSPLATSMSSSRAGGSGLTLCASVISRSVVWPMAETTATTCSPLATVAAMRRLTRRILAAEPTEVPPYFWTITFSRGPHEVSAKPQISWGLQRTEHALVRHLRDEGTSVLRRGGGHDARDADGLRSRAEREHARARAADRRRIRAGAIGRVHDVVHPRVEVQPVRLCEPVTQRLLQERWPLGGDRTHEQGGARRVVHRGFHRHRIGKHRSRLVGGQRRVRHEQRQAPAGVRQALVEVFGDDADAARRARGDVVEVALVRARVDDVALDVPRLGQRRRSQSRGRAAAEADAHRDLAFDQALELHLGERVGMRRQVLRALAFVVPRGLICGLGDDLHPEVDRHRHAVETWADVGDRRGNANSHSFKTLASVRASPSSSIGGSTFFKAASGSFRPEPVRTTTAVASFSMRPSCTSLMSSASGAADAGSQNRPSPLASLTWAEMISVSDTAAIMPPDSSRALVAPSHDAGFPMRIAEAIVFGWSTGWPVTMGAAPSA